jgi:short-subunit dehydrogenase
MSNKGTSLITGASTGIGAVYADRLAKRGYDLILVARSKDKLDDVAKQIHSSTGREVETLQADLSVPAAVKCIADRLASDTSITAFANMPELPPPANCLIPTPTTSIRLFR